MSPMEPEDRFDERTYAIIGAAQEVHRTLGCGYLERVYQCALANELRRRAIPFESEVALPITYKGDLLDCSYRLDFLCFQEVIVELKALAGLGPVEEAQAFNYLKASSLDVALLLNFGGLRLEVQRVSCSRWGGDTPSEPSASSTDG